VRWFLASRLFASRRARVTTRFNRAAINRHRIYARTHVNATSARRADQLILPCGSRQTMPLPGAYRNIDGLSAKILEL